MSYYQEQQPPMRTGLLDFLRKSQGSQFVIPVYQRNYTWKANDEVNQYLDDVVNVMNGTYPKHFLGIMIYLDTPIDTFSREFLVIDGQQRLTTTFLILYAVRAILLEQGNYQEANKIEKQILINEYVEDKLKFKLKPLVADDTVYMKIVNNQLDSIEDKEKQSNVYKNYFEIKSFIESLISNGKTIQDFLEAINKLYVVCIPISKDDNAQKIFESINSTGAKLSASDLIRNYILMDIQSDTQESFYKNYWKVLEDIISSDSKKLESFFRLFLASQNRVLPGASKVYSCYKEWQERVKGNDIEFVLKTIVEYARYYQIIYNTTLENVDSQYRNAIKEYRKTFSDMPTPFFMELMHIASQTDDNGCPLISGATISKIIQLVNTYLIRRSLCALDTSDITRFFPSLLNKVLEDCKRDYTNIYEYTKKWLVNQNNGKAAYMPDNNELFSYLDTANVYVNRSTIKVVFDKIETFNNPAVINLKDLSIEHLMPQTPTDDWLAVLSVDEETYYKNLHRLGNLTIATKSDNSKMSNNPFDYKKAILTDTSHIKMNKEILDMPSWGIKEISKRTTALIKRIIELYPYESASDDFIKKHEVYIENGELLTTGYLFEDGSVEIQPGSTFVKYESPHPVGGIDECYHQLLEEGVIRENYKEAVFIKPYSFDTPSRGASFVLHSNRNGFNYWHDNSGMSIEKSGLKKKLGL